MLSIQTLPLLVFPVLLVVAALKDVTSFTIPNWISGVLLLAFPVGAFAAGLSWGEVAQHAAVGGVALLIGMGMFAMNWMGGGDAKLLSASALWLGLSGAPSYLMWTALAGGGLAVTLIAARKVRAAMPVATGPRWVGALLEPKGDIPYGVALAAGALLAFPSSGLFLASC
jgi:prepilin peptidase CpaA